MVKQPAYRRVLLKLSGELLQGAKPYGIAPEAVGHIAARVREIVHLGVEVALVIGAGNIFRGLPASRTGIGRTCADQMGMLATVMNALAMRDALEADGLSAQVQSAIPMSGIVAAFDQREATHRLAAKHVVLFAGGTGHPYFTTDTTAALRACEIGADALLKGTKVDGVYSADPEKTEDAVRFSRLSYADALSNRLSVLDSTAFALCQDNNVPIVVFDFAAPGALAEIAHGDLRRATLVSDADTRVG